MKVYHLNCGTLCPACERLIHGFGQWTKPAKLCCHCLLIETNNKLILVDTGFGTADVQQPNQRLGRMFKTMLRPQLDLQETAYHQLKQLGFSPSDVTDILPTHLDLDHAGGLSDFPQAKVHIYQAEVDAALHPRLKERLRYRLMQFKHQPKWQTYQTPQQSWFNFKSFDLSEQFGFELNLVPLIGHTRGHAGIAIKQHNTWMMHCGDAYFHRSQVSADPSQMPVLLKLFEKEVQTLKQQRVDTQVQLRQLKQQHPDIDLFCAHDIVEFAQHTLKI